ncbi:MAG TPA: virulence factor MviN, partial [Microbacterium sp.]|nr:virulence factor MviN [Microbacterium sp.]
LAAAVALGQSIASIVQVIIATWLLERRLTGVGIASWMLSLARFTLAAVPSAAAGWLIFILCGGAGGWMASSQLLGAVGAAIVGLASVAVYVGLLALLRAPELSAATALVRRFLPGRR